MMREIDLIRAFVFWYFCALPRVSSFCLFKFFLTISDHSFTVVLLIGSVVVEHRSEPGDLFPELFHESSSV